MGLFAVALLLAAGEDSRPERLLTRAQLVEAPVEELSFRQLELEAARLEEPEAIWPAIALLASGGVVSTGAFLPFAVSTYYFLQPFHTVTDGLVFGFSLPVEAAGVAIVGAGSILLPILLRRREKAAERYQAVRIRLVAIRDGSILDLRPQPPDRIAELLRLEDARPRLELPISLIGGGATVIVGALPLWFNINRRVTAAGGDIALAVALTVAGIALGGAGAYLTIAGQQQRDESDARIEALQSLPLPPPAAHEYWHF